MTWEVTGDDVEKTASNLVNLPDRIAALTAKGSHPT